MISAILVGGSGFILPHPLCPPLPGGEGEDLMGRTHPPLVPLPLPGEGGNGEKGVAPPGIPTDIIYRPGFYFFCGASGFLALSCLGFLTFFLPLLPIK